MKIILATNQHEMSVAIREKLNCKYTHVVVVDGDNVIEARPEAGVVKTPLKVFKRLYPTYEYREMPGDVNKSRALVGKPYDYKGLLGMGFKVYSIQDPKAYFCCEVVGIAADNVDDSMSHTLLPDDFIELSTAVCV
ncbi:hypothetical protein [Paraglaciecola sp.]|uniref:hypothetical protein n=1 Tax=Paraglaciecola sp. TaxID=1920173 RepID=UPI003EF6592C